MFVYLIVDLLFGNGLRKYSDAIVGVTEEITRYQLNRYGDPKKPNITIGNGFNVHSVPERFPPPFSGKELHLICVADFSIWHGIDRLLHGMKLYRGPVKIFTHIVGTGKDTPRLERLVTDLDLTHNVFFHGFQTGKDLDDLFHISHVAVGSLGIHRIGLSQISVLKIREYCSRGIPFIIACDDPDFPDVFPYALKLPPNDDAIDMTTVIQFATGIFHDTDYPQKMRDYALTHLDWSIKMQKLRDFLSKIT
jgi:glycosyltransferase involved in cell wall biosynthesis